MKKLKQIQSGLDIQERNDIYDLRDYPSQGFTCSSSKTQVSRMGEVGRKSSFRNMGDIPNFKKRHVSMQERKPILHLYRRFKIKSIEVSASGTPSQIQNIGRSVIDI